MRVDGLLLGALAALVCLGQTVQTHVLGSAVPWGPLVCGALLFVCAAWGCGEGRAERFLRGRGGWIAWGVAAAMMAALLVFGRRYRGGLYLPGRLNPSELVKLCMVAFAASRLSGPRAFASARDLVLFAAAFGFVAAEVALAGDFGLLAQLVLTVAAMLFAASWFWGLSAFLSVGGAMALFVHLPRSAGGHLATRLEVWRDPLANANGAGWQTLNGLAAVLHGGTGGVGCELAEVGKVPIVASDFVYAAVAEVWGLLGGAAVLLAWALLLLRGLVAAARRAARGNRAEALLATGIASSLGVQAVLNVAGVLNALPMTGITLPLVSYGGSSLVVTLAMCGVLLGLARPYESPEPERKPARRRPVRPRASAAEAEDPA